MLLCALVIFLNFSGCQSLFNPYDDSFQCPDVDEGGCMSIPNAYRQSLSGKSNPEGTCSECRNSLEKNESGLLKSEEAEKSRALYQKKKFEILHHLIDSDKPPIVVPPEVVRVLVMSYTGDEDEMFGYRYIYFFATDPAWLLSTAMEADQGDDR